MESLVASIPARVASVSGMRSPTAPIEAAVRRLGLARWRRAPGLTPRRLSPFESGEDEALPRRRGAASSSLPGVPWTGSPAGLTRGHVAAHHRTEHRGGRAP